MPLAIVVLGLGLSLFATAGQDQVRAERRATALNTTQVGMDRMIREVRQADWVYFTSSSQVDLAAQVRAAGDATASPRHVRYVCSEGACRRYEGPPVSFPPPADAALAATDTVLEGLSNADVFHPRRTDPVTGGSDLDYVTPDSLWIRAVLAIRGFDHPLEVIDGASLRNATRFRG